MTVSSLVPVNTYAGNSSSKKFDFDFLIESNSELIVQHINNKGLKTVLKEGIDYSIHEIGNKEGSYIIFPLESSTYSVLKEDEKISLMLTLIIKQESEFRNSSYFNFNILEWTFDYIVRILQILNRKIERCIKTPEGEDEEDSESFLQKIRENKANTQKYSEYADKKANEAKDNAELAKQWAIKTEDTVDDKEYSSKYYALEAQGYVRQAQSFSTLRYNVFCINTGNIENGKPAFLKIEKNILKTSGSFDLTTIQGKTYTITEELTLNIADVSMGIYNIFINPETKKIKLINNKIYIGEFFPEDAKEGDYLLNTIKPPFDLEKKTTLSNEKGLKDVYAGLLQITYTDKKLDFNEYNRNIFSIEDEKLKKRLGFKLFDIIPKDHILTFEEKEGLELLGEYVYKEAADERYGYPDFYERCIKEYKEGTSNTSEISGITIKVNSNGHKFYNISDKAKIDEIYNKNGVAWYYGVDETNKRILLPRNNYFFQSSKNAGKYIEAGLPNIQGSLRITCGGINETTGAFTKGSNVTTGRFEATAAAADVFNFNASLSNSIYGKSTTVQPNAVGVAVYMVVGNTYVKEYKSALTELTSSENDTIPLGTSMYSPEPLEPNAGWVKSTGLYLSGKIYETFYNKSVAKIGQAFCSGFIKESTESYDDYDLVINQDEMTFRLPLYNGSENIIDCPTRVQKTWGTTFDLTHNSIIYGGAYSSSYDDDGIIQFSYDKGTTWNTLIIHDRGFGEWMSPPFPRGTKIKSSGGTTGVGSEDKYIYIYRCKGSGDLYFKLGNALENQQLIDIGGVLEDLASKPAFNEAAAASMPSSKYNNLTLGISGSTYKAPANGWFILAKNTNAAGEFISLSISPTGLGFTTFSQNNGNGLRASVPVKEGDSLNCYYTATGTTNQFRFIYAEGSK